MMGNQMNKKPLHGGTPPLQDDGLSVSLQAGHLYDFRIKEWEAPTGETILAETKRREFRRLLFRGAVGQPHDPYVEVAHRENGRVHLIALETIERVVPVCAEK